MSQTYFHLVLCHDTLVKTQCCGSHPCGPTVDRHSSVSSGVRYAWGLHDSARRDDVFRLVCSYASRCTTGWTCVTLRRTPRTFSCALRTGFPLLVVVNLRGGQVQFLSDRVIKLLGGMVQLLSSCSAVIVWVLGHVLPGAWTSIVRPSSCLAAGQTEIVGSKFGFTGIVRPPSCLVAGRTVFAGSMSGGRRSGWRHWRLGSSSCLAAWVRRPCTKNSRFFVSVESPHSSKGSRTVGDGMFFGGKSWSPSSEALGLRSSVRWAEGASGEVQSVLFGRQAAWRPGAFVDKLCWRRSEHSPLLRDLPWSEVKTQRARRVRARRHAQQIPCLWQGSAVLVGLRLPPLVHSAVPTRAVLASETRTHGPVWIDDGKELLRHQRQSKRMEVTWYTFPHGWWPKPLRPVSCATRRRRGAQLVRLSSRGSIRLRSRAGPSQWQFSSRSSGLLRCPSGSRWNERFALRGAITSSMFGHHRARRSWCDEGLGRTVVWCHTSGDLGGGRRGHPWWGGDAAQVAASCSPPARRGLAVEASTHCRQVGGQADRFGVHVGHWQETAVQAGADHRWSEHRVEGVRLVLAVPSLVHGQ